MEATLAEDAAELPAEDGEAELELPEVTLQTFACLIAEDHGPEWEVPLKVIQIPGTGKHGKKLQALVNS